MSDGYDADRVERRWRERWADETDPPPDPDVVIDTPPPYPTGELHVGHGLNWAYADFVARYRRLRGDDVLFPQGWDCHGLPTEVKVEAEHGVDRAAVSRERFRALCVEHTEEKVAAMRETMHLLGFSQDWGAEYRTMDPEYRALVQRSFARMWDSGHVYRDDHPVNWCPDCETAIADAEVETEAGVEGRLHRIAFPPGTGADGPLAVATTRPELLPACVAVFVHPDDDLAARAGERLRVPLFDREVPVVADADVDPAFGTGAVMVCTFGDEQDAEWWARHDLPLRDVVGPDGRLTDAAGAYAGLDLDAARDRVVADLDAAGLLRETSAIEQSVGVCWRCDTPVETRSTEQWFVRVDADRLLDRADEVTWTPESAHDRLREWTESLQWDWVISRQRDFATPIPAWECGDCGRIRVADESRLPVDPTADDPDGPCPDCGAEAWVGETDVLDTWMDSSVTPLWLRDWPDEPFEPLQLRPQGHDIVRTWAFYTLLRVDALTGEVAWERALVNGMVFGADGEMMSKSKGNAVSPRETVAEFSADAFRQALALAGRPGSDVQFDRGDVASASRFVTKLWNVAEFARDHCAAPPPPADADLRTTDRWLLDRLAAVRDAVTDRMDDHRFDAALRELRGFVRGDLADDYLELVKGRLYDGDPADREAAAATLDEAVRSVLVMLAPFAPFVTAEAYDRLPSTTGEVHDAAWPPARERDPDADRRGETIAGVARAVRRWKSDRGLALNASLPGVTVYADERVETLDLSNATGAPVAVETGDPDLRRVATGVEVDYGVLGPRYGERAERVAEACRADPEAVAAAVDAGEPATVTVGGDAVDVPPDAVTVEWTYRAPDGTAVEVVETDRAVVLVEPP